MAAARNGIMVVSTGWLRSLGGAAVLRRGTDPRAQRHRREQLRMSPKCDGECTARQVTLTVRLPQSRKRFMHWYDGIAWRCMSLNVPYASLAMVGTCSARVRGACLCGKRLPCVFHAS